jgi:hypothetical protein
MSRKSGLLLHQREAAILFNITISQFSSVLSPFCSFFLITALFIYNLEAGELSRYRMGYELDNPDSILGNARFLSSPRRPDRLWGPPNLLANANWRLFPRR